MEHILQVKDPKFYAFINNRWKRATELQVRTLMYEVARATLNGESHDIRVKDENGRIANIRPDGMLDKDLHGFTHCASQTLKLVKLQQELHNNV